MVPCRQGCTTQSLNVWKTAMSRFIWEGHAGKYSIVPITKANSPGLPPSRWVPRRKGDSSTQCPAPLPFPEFKKSSKRTFGNTQCLTISTNSIRSPLQQCSYGSTCAWQNSTTKNVCLISPANSNGKCGGIDSLLYSADAKFLCFADLAITSSGKYYKFRK